MKRTLLSLIRPRYFTATILMAWTWWAMAAWAQVPTAVLNGIVTDPQGAVIANAAITATNIDTGAERSTQSTSEGRFAFAGLPAGTYRVSVSARDFARREFTGVQLQVGRSLTLDIALSLASVSESTSVGATIGTVELTESKVQSQIQANTLEKMPLNGRNYLELAFLLPGNRPAVNFDPTKTNTLDVSSAGQFGRGGNITVDGGDNNNEAVGGALMNFPQDAIQEFQIVTNRYTAEVGRSASSIINVATKSGTNDLHGSAFFFLRDDSLQARPATLAATADKPAFDREQFGGSVGGALKKDTAFYFLSGEYRNQDATVPVGSRDLAARRIVTGAAAAPLDDFLLLGRTDLKLNNRDSAYVRYAYNGSEETANGSLGRPLGTAANRQTANNDFHSILGTYTRAGARSVNTLSVHYNTFVNEMPPFAENRPSLTPDQGYAHELRFPSLQDGANFRVPQDTRVKRFQVRDNYSVVLGKHTVQFGGEAQRHMVDAMFDLFGSGTLMLAEDFATMDRNGDGQVNDLDIPIAVAIRSVAPNRPPTVKGINNTYLGAFVQDDYRVLPNLTLNIGLRYEVDTDATGIGGAHEACPEPLGVAPDRPCVWINGVLGIKRERDLKNFAPRVGFAYDPLRNGTTVVRGGYGVYYDRIVAEDRMLELLSDGRQLAVDVLAGSTLTSDGRFSTDAGTGQVVSLANPFGGQHSALPIGINVIAPNAAHPYVQQFTLGVQQQIGKTIVVSVDGVHNFGTRLLIGRLLRDGSNAPVRVTDPLTGRSDNIVQIEPSAKSFYDGLLVNVRKAQTRVGPFAYALNVSYTLSKALSYANDDQVPFAVDQHADLLFGVNNLQLEKGYSPVDERHRLVVYGSLTAPLGLTVSPLITFSSSVPMNSFVPEINGRLPILARNALGREVKTGAELNEVITRWNGLPSCPGGFPCRVGSALPLVRSDLQFGDAFVSTDLRVTKTFKVTERSKLDVIGEVFNLTNTTNVRGSNNNNYSGRNNAVTSPDFNRALSTAGGYFGAGGPRAFQLALRYAF